MRVRRMVWVTGLLLLMLPALACGPLGLLGLTEEEEAEPQPVEEAPPPVEEAPPPVEEAPPQEPPQEGGLCGDGVCDEAEQANPALCPQDCGEAPPQIDLTGVWNSPEWGMMELAQTGDQVVGTYVYEEGQLDGRLEGLRFNYRWWQNAPGQPYESVTDPSQRGDGYFDVSPDGNHLAGEWRFADSSSWDGTWTADRQ